ncbi:MAG: hypothetical protein RIQ46_397, partial [Pseudomonadota bacterium]
MTKRSPRLAMAILTASTFLATPALAAAAQEDGQHHRSAHDG